MLPVENVAGVAGELLEEGALGPAVAFAERVDGVDLAEVVGQPLGERTPGQAAQEALTVQSAEDLCCGGLDVLRQAEPGPFAMATVLSCPAQSLMSPKTRWWIAHS